LAKGVHDERYRALISRLADRRRELGLSQEMVARLLGRRQQYVSKYESYERRLDVVEFADAARALQISPSHLLDMIYAL
jgi:transcriptional regulator with XRE-family HTH domain